MRDGSILVVKICICLPSKSIWNELWLEGRVSKIRLGSWSDCIHDLGVVCDWAAGLSTTLTNGPSVPYWF